jgi:phospholipase A-2-activating protein
VIRLLTIDGHLLGELHGHENFIYSLALLPSGEIVSAGEDRTVRIWNNGQTVQVITHPAISVWAVAVCKENGDIVTGASDKIVRIFSRLQNRQAAPEVIASFEDSVKASAIPQQALGGINKTDLPGPEFLTSKSGTKEGQVQMVKETNGNVSAYQWSTAANQWVMIGTVVDAAGGGSKTSYNGKEYDYVFDVDIKDGELPLKLPFNTTQNPYEAAQKFLNDNELPAAYLDQVAQFIITNSQGATLGQQQQNNAPGSDPWGQESRYRPGEGNAPAPPTAASKPKILPQTSYLTITTANLPTIAKKVQEFNQQLEADGRKDITLNASNIQILQKTTQQLDAITKGQTASLTAEGIQMIVHIATQWPADKRLPGLDLLRLASASEKFVEATSSGDTTLLDLLAPADNISANAPLNNAMMAVRALSNLFAHEAGRTLMDSSFDAVHALVSPFLTSSNRNMIVALTTLYINYAVLLHAVAPNHNTDRAITLLDELTKILTSAQDAEALYRALVGAGTLLSLGQDFRDLAREALEFDEALKKVANNTAGKEPRVKAVIEELKGDGM